MSRTLENKKADSFNLIFKKLYNKVFPYFGCIEEVLELSKNTLVSESYYYLITASSFIFRITSIVSYYKKIKEKKLPLDFCIKDLALFLVVLITYQFQDRILNQVLRITKNEPTQLEKFSYRLVVLLTLYKIRNRTISYRLFIFGLIPLMAETFCSTIKQEGYERRGMQNPTVKNILLKRPSVLEYKIIQGISSNIIDQVDHLEEDLSETTLEEELNRIVLHSDTQKYQKILKITSGSVDKSLITPLLKLIVTGTTPISQEALKEHITSISDTDILDSSIEPDIVEERIKLYEILVINVWKEIQIKQLSLYYQLKRQLNSNQKISDSIYSVNPWLVVLLYIFADILFFSIYGYLYNFSNNYEMNAEYNHQVVKLFKFEVADAIAIFLVALLEIVIKNKENLTENEKKNIITKLEDPVKSLSITSVLLDYIKDRPSIRDREYKSYSYLLQTMEHYYYSPKPYFYREENIIEGRIGHAIGITTFILTNLLLFLELFKLDLLIIDTEQGSVSEEIGIESTYIIVQVIKSICNINSRVKTIYVHADPSIMLIGFVGQLLTNYIHYRYMIKEHITLEDNSLNKL